MAHYIPLRKDFSNLDEVIGRFRDPELRRELTENSHRDLIASGDYSYERFVEGFDRDLIDAGLEPEAGFDPVPVAAAIEHGRRWSALRVQLRWIVHLHAVGWVLTRVFRVTGFLRRLIRGKASLAE